MFPLFTEKKWACLWITKVPSVFTLFLFDQCSFRIEKVNIYLTKGYYKRTNTTWKQHTFQSRRIKIWYYILISTIICIETWNTLSVGNFFKRATHHTKLKMSVSFGGVGASGIIYFILFILFNYFICFGFIYFYYQESALHASKHVSANQ